MKFWEPLSNRSNNNYFQKGNDYKKTMILLFLNEAFSMHRLIYGRNDYQKAWFIKFIKQIMWYNIWFHFMTQNVSIFDWYDKKKVINRKHMLPKFNEFLYCRDLSIVKIMNKSKRKTKPLRIKYSSIRIFICYDKHLIMLLVECIASSHIIHKICIYCVCFIKFHKTNKKNRWKGNDTNVCRHIESSDAFVYIKLKNRSNETKETVRRVFEKPYGNRHHKKDSLNSNTVGILSHRWIISLKPHCVSCASFPHSMFFLMAICFQSQGIHFWSSVKC